jgi:hypothetical protein
MRDKPSENENVDWDATEGQLVTPEQRKELRRDTLRYARLLPPGAERNQFRSIARSLTFFETGLTNNSVGEKGPPARSRVANVELLRRR